MKGRLGAFRELGQEPRSLRAVIAFGLFSMAEQAAWVAILVYAYDRGGAAAAGAAAVVQVVPAALLAPVLALIGDRRRDLALPVGYAAQAAALGVTATVLFAGAPVWVVICCSVLVTCAMATTRPAHAAVLPMVARTPEGLTAANVASGLMANLGSFTGPALAGLSLRLADAGTAFAIAAAASVAGGVLSLRVVDRRDEASSGGGWLASVRGATGEGVRALLGDSNIRVLSITEAARGVLVGALELLLVATAVDLIGTGEGGAGFLHAVLGLGGVVGAALSVSLIGRKRLVPAIAAGNLALGAPLAAAAGVPTALTVPAFVFFAGSGNALLSVAAQALLQRSIPDRLRARGFGVLEGISTLALAVGAVVGSVLLAAVGVRGALAAAGASTPIIMLLTYERLALTDRLAAPPDPVRIALLRRISMFAPLPPLELEAVASAFRPLEIAAGEVLMTQGEVGDRFYVLVAGRLSIRKEETEVATCEPGGYVGEIALLRDVPRTATVLALEPSFLLALERDPFLEAVTGHPRSRAAAERVADARSGNVPGSNAAEG